MRLTPTALSSACRPRLSYWVRWLILALAIPPFWAPRGAALRRSHRKIGHYYCLLLLLFVHRGVSYCGAVAPRVTAALLGRFLPRLGPLAPASGPFFLVESVPADAVHSAAAR